MSNSKIDIKSMNLAELIEFVASIGEKAFRAKQLYQWLHVKQVYAFDDMTNLSKAFREKLGEVSFITDLKQEQVQICVKYYTIKSVIIKLNVCNARHSSIE